MENDYAFYTMNPPGLPKGWFDEFDVAAYREIYASQPDNIKAVEVGCFMGRSLCSVADILLAKNISVVAVDAFNPQPKNETFAAVLNSLDLKATCAENLASFGITTEVELIKMPSHQASELFEENYFDLIFLDADHTYQSVIRDIECWRPRLKPGGLLAGHDYGNSHLGVDKAVQEVFGDKFHWHKPANIWSKLTA